jgi:hypothetical protein
MITGDSDIVVKKIEKEALAHLKQMTATAAA